MLYGPTMTTGARYIDAPELVRILYVSTRPVNVWDYARTLEDAVREYCMPKLLAAVDVMREGMEALNQAAAADYDIIITCSDLPPPLTARELAERLRELGVEAKLVLVVEGGHKKKPSMEQEAAQQGFDALLTPPLSRKSFSAGIAALVLGPEGSAPVLAATAQPPLPPMPPGHYWDGALSIPESSQPPLPSNRGGANRSSPVLSKGEGPAEEEEEPEMPPPIEGWGQSGAMRHIVKHISLEQARKRSQKRPRPPEWEAGAAPGYQAGSTGVAGEVGLQGWEQQPPPVLMQLG